MTFNYYTQLPQNWQWSLTINISWQQLNMSIMYRKHDHHSFSSWSGNLQLHLIYRTQQCNRTCFRRSTSRKSWRYNFCCKALQSMELTRLRSLRLGSMNSSAQETGDTCMVNCRFNHSILSLHLCKEYLTGVKWKHFSYSKVLNVLMYGLLCFDQIQYVGERMKWS